MPFNWQQRWLPLIIPLILFLAWLALALLPHYAEGAPAEEASHPQILIKPGDLKARLDQKDPDLRIIDFRHKAKYYLGHIPGALQLWRTDIAEHRQSRPGLPPAAYLEKLLGRLGVGSRNIIVIYSDQCDHAYLWWLLVRYGFPLSQLRLLDGGLGAWMAAGYPTQLTSPRFKPTSFRFPAAPPADFLLATLEQVKGAQTIPDRVILDVRPPKLFLGVENKEGAPRPGRIPGAVGVYWQENRMTAGPAKGCWKNAAELKELYASRGVTPDKDILIYGHHDYCAAFTLVSLYLAGCPLEKLHVFGGGWIDWSRSQEPVETGPAK